MKTNNSERRIWDVMFSLPKSFFPVERNYIREPRGSLNPINSEVSLKASQPIVDLVKQSFKTLDSLYALDFELNYFMRQLADVTLFAQDYIVKIFLDGDNDCPEFDVTCSPLANVIDSHDRYDDLFLCCDALNEALCLALERDNIREGRYELQEKKNMIRAAELQVATQYLIETSEHDWRAKAEAFLKASSLRRYAPADDETLIYLLSLSPYDPLLRDEAKRRLERYRNEWDQLYFTDKNPFDGSFEPNMLRLIHWNKLSELRWFESRLPSNGAYEYRYNSQHLLIPEFLSDFARIFSLFRSTLNVEPIESALRKLVRRIFDLTFCNREYDFHYTHSDFYYLSSLLFEFAHSRFKNDILDDRSIPLFDDVARGAIELPRRCMTGEFVKEIPLVTLIALEVHAVYFASPRGAVQFLQEARQWLLAQQTSYGYWYDGVHNPEYTTVLVLDALNLIEGKETTFPHHIRSPREQDEAANDVQDAKTSEDAIGAECKEQDTSEPVNSTPQVKDTEQSGTVHEVVDETVDEQLPNLLVNFDRWQLHFGSYEVELDPKRVVWDFIVALVDSETIGQELLIRATSGKGGWKNQLDTLKNLIRRQTKLSAPYVTKLLNHWISSKGGVYRRTTHFRFKKPGWDGFGRPF